MNSEKPKWVGTPKYDEGKPAWHVLPYKALEEVVRVFEYGAKKYGKPLTYRKGIPYSKLFDATLRHLISWFWYRESTDKESGCHHLAHVCANALMLLTIIQSHDTNNQFDDRPLGRSNSVSVYNKSYSPLESPKYNTTGD